MPEKKDFFGLCDRDDSNLTNPCKECKHSWYVFTCWLKSKFKRKDVQK